MSIQIIYVVIFPPNNGICNAQRSYNDIQYKDVQYHAALSKWYVTITTQVPVVSLSDIIM